MGASTSAGPGPLVRAARAIAARLTGVPRAAGVALTLAWLILIWTVSARTPSELHVPEFAGGWLTNLAHAPEYAALAVWLALALRGAGEPPAARAASRALALLLAAFFGAVDELHQSGVPGRDASVLDLATDVLGAAWALLLLADLHAPEPTLHAQEPGLPAPERAARPFTTLWVGAAACAASAGLATLLPTWWPNASWL